VTWSFVTFTTSSLYVPISYVFPWDESSAFQGHSNIYYKHEFYGLHPVNRRPQTNQYQNHCQYDKKYPLLSQENLTENEVRQIQTSTSRKEDIWKIHNNHYQYLVNPLQDPLRSCMQILLLMPGCCLLVLSLLPCCIYCTMLSKAAEKPVNSLYCAQT
jgi:hypothetical protein